jgi:hypothetical protein
MNRRQFLKATTQATAVVAPSAGLGGVAAPLIARAGEAARPRASRISHYCDGRMLVNALHPTRSRN